MTTTIDGVKTLQIRKAKNGDFDLNFARVCDCSYLENAVLNAYPTESESGNPIYFDDGADDIPVKELIVSLEPKQEGSGDPSPSNVRPISGYDGVKVKRNGKNLLNPISMQSKTVNGVTFTIEDDGVHTNGTATNAIYYDFVLRTEAQMLKAGTYTLHSTGCPLNTVYANIAEKADQNLIASARSTSVTFTVAEDKEYFGFIYIPSGTNMDGYVLTLMIELGSNETDYEPYTEQEYSITFPSSVGTVYGGALNVTTGVLTVDRAKLNNSTWTIDTTNQRAYFSSRATFGTSESNDVATDKIICSKLPTISLKALMDDKTQGIALSTSGALSLHIDGVTDESSFTQADVNTWLSDVDIIYKMASPITYQLTPTEVNTLLGSNTIQSDGSMDLSYRADINKIIERLRNA